MRSVVTAWMMITVAAMTAAEIVPLVMGQALYIDDGLCHIDRRREGVVREAMAMNGSVVHDHGVNRQRLVVDLDAISGFDFDLAAAMLGGSCRGETFLVIMVPPPGL